MFVVSTRMRPFQSMSEVSTSCTFTQVRQRKTISADASKSALDETVSGASGSDRDAERLSGPLLLASKTSWPDLANFAASVMPTVAAPMIPIFTWQLLELWVRRDS